MFADIFLKIPAADTVEGFVFERGISFTGTTACFSTFLAGRSGGELRRLCFSTCFCEVAFGWECSECLARRGLGTGDAAFATRWAFSRAMVDVLLRNCTVPEETKDRIPLN